VAVKLHGRRSKPEYSAGRFIEIAGGDESVDGWPFEILRVEGQQAHLAKNVPRHIGDLSRPSDHQIE
jgi:hypothetical protein